MTGARWLSDAIGADPADAGCARAVDVLDQYVEAQRGGQDPERMFPSAAADLHSCPSCRQDYEGLLAAID